MVVGVAELQVPFSRRICHDPAEFRRDLTITPVTSTKSRPWLVQKRCVLKQHVKYDLFSPRVVRPYCRQYRRDIGWSYGYPNRLLVETRKKISAQPAVRTDLTHSWTHVLTNSRTHEPTLISQKVFIYEVVLQESIPAQIRQLILYYY